MGLARQGVGFCDSASTCGSALNVIGLVVYLNRFFTLGYNSRQKLNFYKLLTAATNLNSIKTTGKAR